MKVEWEKKDITAGKRYSKEGIQEVWIIGFMSWEKRDGEYVSVSLVDGMVFGPPKTKEQMARDLTDGGYLPIGLLDYWRVKNEHRNCDDPEKYN